MYQDGTYLAHNPGWHQSDSAWKAGHIRRLLDRNDIRAASVCEVGCGAGEVLRQLQATDYGPGVEFVGYDISVQAFELSRVKAGPHLRFELGDPFDQHPQPRFDVALAVDVFEHVEDYLGFLRQLRRLAPLNVFHIPLDLSVQSLVRGRPIMDKRRTVGHIHYFTKETALAALEDAGHDIVDHCYTAAVLDLPAASRLSAVAKLPRRLAYRIDRDLAVRVLGGWSLLVLTR